MVYFAVIAALFFGELLIKNIIEAKQEEGETKEFLGGRLLISKFHNRGLAFGRGSGRQPLIAAISLGMAVCCTLLFLMSVGRRGSALLNAGLAILLGGAYSNTYDRLKRRYVVDYVSFGVKWKRLRNIIFNISDFCIMIGAMICVIANYTNG